MDLVEKIGFPLADVIPDLILLLYQRSRTHPLLIPIIRKKRERIIIHFSFILFDSTIPIDVLIPFSLGSLLWMMGLSASGQAC